LLVADEVLSAVAAGHRQVAGAQQPLVREIGDECGVLVVRMRGQHNEPGHAGGQPNDPARKAFQPPGFTIDSINTATDAGVALDPQQSASRGFLGIVFVVLLFITVVIYGMWVATGVASEKSSRVMELMISAASPRQMLTGKVLGIGAATVMLYVELLPPVPALGTVLRVSPPAT